MIKLRHAAPGEEAFAMDIIDMGKAFLKAQNIDQWQSGYPDYACIERDIQNQKGYFLIEGEELLGYLCIDYDGEPAYEGLNGAWNTDKPYVVVHRMAFSDHARGKNISSAAFALVEELSRNKGILSFRVDTDQDNKIMQHVLKKNGFSYTGTIWFDNSTKIAFDKKISG
jgi:RimJ/RimL family protein N-acetyltransferase